MQNDDLEQALSCLKLKEPGNHYFSHGRHLIQRQLKATRHIRSSRRLNIALALTLVVSLSFNLLQQFETQITDAESLSQVCTPESDNQSAATIIMRNRHEA